MTHSRKLGIELSGFHKILGTSCLAEQLLAFQKRLNSMELVAQLVSHKLRLQTVNLQPVCLRVNRYNEQETSARVGTLPQDGDISRIVQSVTAHC